METELRPLWKDIPQLPIEERDRRWGNVRTAMAAEEIDCLVVWSTGRAEHVRYLSQLVISGVLVFPLKGEPIAFTDMLKSGKYAKACFTWVDELREDIESLPAFLKSLGLDGATIGIVSYRSPHSRIPREDSLPRASWIRSTLPNARLVNATPILERLEMIKSPPEIAFLKKAAEIAYDVFEAMANAARPGATECEVYASMLAAQTAKGGDVADIRLDIGSPVHLHGRVAPFTTRKLQKGDVLVVEYHTSYGGYLAATEHTISIGEPAQEYVEIHEVAERSFREGMASMTVGAKFEEVIRAYRQPADEAGMAYVELGIHGHGLVSCEFPTTVFGGKGGMLHDHYLGQIPDVTLQEGMVFGQNIDIHNPSWNHNSGVMLGDTIWVTRQGPQKLSQIPVELTVV